MQRVFSPLNTLKYRIWQRVVYAMSVREFNQRRRRRRGRRRGRRQEMQLQSSIRKGNTKT